MKTLINDYLKYSTIRRSPNTISSYRTDLLQFLKHLEANRVKNWANVEPSHIDSFLMSISSVRTKASLKRKLAAISSFFNYLNRNNILDKNPARLVEKINLPIRKPDYLSREEMHDLRQACYNNVLLSTIVEFLFTTGIRVSELVSLNERAVDFGNRTANVIGKGDKERTVFFSETASQLLQEYLESREDNNEALLVNAKGERMNRYAIYYRIRKLGRKSIGRDIYPHKFRHTLGTFAVEGGMTLPEVKELLGHASVSTTIQYTHPTAATREHYDKAIERI